MEQQKSIPKMIAAQNMENFLPESLSSNCNWSIMIHKYCTYSMNENKLIKTNHLSSTVENSRPRNQLTEARNNKPQKK